MKRGSNIGFGPQGLSGAFPMTWVALNSLTLNGTQRESNLCVCVHVCVCSLLQGVHPRPLVRHHPEPSVLSGRRDSGAGPREAPVQRGPAGAAGTPHPGGGDVVRRSAVAPRVRLSLV